MTQNQGTANHKTRCPFCREEIMMGAVKCKHCDSVIVSLAAPPRQMPVNRDDGAIWLALPSLIVGGLSAVAPLYLAFFESAGIELAPFPSLRLFVISLTGLVLGVVAQRNYQSRRTMSRIGIALSGVGILASLVMAAS